MKQNDPYMPETGVRALWHRISEKLDALISHDLLALISRLALASVFFLSGRTKVVPGSMLTLSDNTYFLFAEEYKVPLIPPQFAAVMATYAEHFLPLLLVVGFLTRLSALGLLGMTAVIQIFVYPSAWPTHLIWLVPLLYLIGRGGGAWSVDRMLRIS